MCEQARRAPESISEADNSIQMALETEVPRVAKSLVRQHRSHVEQPEIENELWLWAIENRSRITAWPDSYGEKDWRRVLRKALQAHGHEYCAEAKRHLALTHPASSAEARQSFTDLPEEDQAMLRAWKVEGRTQAQLADELGVSQPTISRRLGRIMDRLLTDHLLRRDDDGSSWTPRAANTVLLGHDQDGGHVSLRLNGRPGRTSASWPDDDQIRTAEDCQ